jgi:predicted nucleic acid-binding protein
MIILDTDVLIEIFDKESTKGDIAIEKIEEIGEDIAITSISLHEIQYGIYKFGKKKIKELDQIDILDFNREDAKLSAKLELECERKGKVVSRTDSMIAAIAINRKAKIFTFNKKHFQSFSKLKLL